MSDQLFDQGATPAQRLRDIETHVADIPELDLPTERAHFANQANWNALWLEAIDRRITTEGSAS